MYFPVAGIELNPLIPLVLGLAVSLVSAPSGISGGLLLLPISINFLGFTSLAVSPTNFIFNIVAVPLGLWRLHVEKRLMWGLGGLILLGLLPGIFVGTILRCTWLSQATDYKVYVALILSVLALGILSNICRRNLLTTKAEKFFASNRKVLSDLNCRYSFHLVSYYFGGENFRVSTPRLIFCSLAAGVVGGSYGVGGAAIIAPLLIVFFRIPIYLVSGASLLAGWAGAVFGLFSYLVLWPFISGEASIGPDWGLGLLFGLGGIVGVYLGSVCQRFLPSLPLKIILLLLLCVLAAQDFGLI